MLGTYRQRLLGSVLTISCLALVGAPAMAAESASGGSGAVEVVIVTAGKRAEALREVPMAVTAIGGDTLERQNLTSFADYINHVPGMNFVASDPGHTILILRGVNTGSVSSTVGTYLDETPYGSSSALANGLISTPNIDTFDIERIEVLSGPQGTLYGASTMGGLIKFVTRAPDTTAFSAKVEGGVDTTEHGDTGWSVRGMVNVPLTDTFAIRASAYRWREGGFIDDPMQHKQDINGVDNVGGRASALWQPNDHFSVRLNALFQNLDADGGSQVDVTFNPDTTVNLHPLFGDLQQGRASTEYANVRYRVYNATINYDFGWATLTSATSYDTFRDNNDTDATGGALGLPAFVVAELRQKKFTEEVRLASPTGSTWEWLVGVYYTHEDAVLHQDVNVTLDTPPIGFLQLDSTYIEKAAFANVTYHFSPQFDLALGGRWADDRQHANQSDNLGIPPSSGRSSESVFTWSVAPRWHVDENTMVYGRIAKGFRPGGPNVVPLGNPAGVPTTFDSDSLTNYEIGLKTTALDGRLEFNIDAFYINWKDIQLLVVINNTGVDANGSTASSKGIELSATWRPVDALTIVAGGAWTDAKLTGDTDPITVGGLDGDRLPYVPRFSSSIDADYVFQPIGDVTPFLGAGWRFIGERESGFVARPPFGNGPQTHLPSYNVVDLRAGLDYDRWTLQLYGKNIFDADGITSLSSTGTSAVSGSAPSIAVIRPRTIGVTLQGKF